MKPSICLEHVNKQYGKNKAVFDISFSILQGQISAFLGPNGAGKSTTMNLRCTKICITEVVYIIRKNSK